MRGLVCQELRRRLRVLRLLYQFDDLRQRRVGSDFGRLVAKAAALVDGRTDDGSSRPLLDRHRLTGEHGFVDQRFAGLDRAVHRYLVAGPNHHNLAGQHFGRRDFDLGAVADHGGLRRREVHQRLDGRRRARARAHFQPVPKQDEHQQHRHGLVELPTFVEEEGGADAEEIPGAHAQDDQRRHAQRALQQPTPRRDEERPARVENRGACEEEQPQVELQAERRRRRFEHASHRRVDKDRHGEEQADPEAISHVAHHGFHVGAAMTHLMGHLRRHGGAGCARLGVTWVPLVTAG